jgi:hypothetical protein
MEDMFAPVCWATAKAKSFWVTAGYGDMGVQVRLMEAHTIGKLDSMWLNLIFNDLPT